MHPMQPNVYGLSDKEMVFAGGAVVEGMPLSQGIGFPDAISDPQMFGSVVVWAAGSEYCTQFVIWFAEQGGEVLSVMKTALDGVVPTVRLS
jgi:hypothetical protein